MKFFKIDFTNDYFVYKLLLKKFWQIFQILYYRNIGFLEMKFFKLILQTIILNIVYF